VTSNGISNVDQRRKKMKKKMYLVVVVVLSLLLPLITACGGGGSNPTSAPTTPVVTTTPNVTITVTPTATAIITSTPSPTTSGNPVKIGAINAWSGPVALSGVLSDPVIKLVEWQVKQQGGILGGRELKIVKYDDAGSLPQGVAGANKLVLDEKVSAIVWGGAQGAEFEAISNETEKLKVLFVPLTLPTVADKKFSVAVMPAFQALVNGPVKLVTEVLKPKTVAILITGGWEDKARVAEGWKQGVEASGINVVYSDATMVGTMDYSPYLTKIKYNNPDVLMMNM
jgi:branched-chain amino acid transport system substrate-binding protein